MNQFFAEMDECDSNAVEHYLNDSYEQCGDNDDLFMHKSDFMPAPIAEHPKKDLSIQDFILSLFFFFHSNLTFFKNYFN